MQSPERSVLSPSRGPRPSAPVAVLLAFVLLLAGVAPSVSRVIAAAIGTHDLCRVDDARRGDPGSDPDAGHDAACALCLAHGATHAAPPPAVGSAIASIVVAAGPAGRGPQPARAVAWQAPQPRGPPTRA
jgi:hypothetical protein